MRHYVSQLSLTHGWLPVAAQLVTAAALLCAVGWRSRRWRVLCIPLMSLAGVLFAFAAHSYIDSVGIAGDPAPHMLWVWIAVTGVATVVLLLGWRGARWARRGLSILALPLCLLSAALTLNQWVGYFPTVHTAWNQLTAGPLPDQTDRLTVTAMQLRGAKPTMGVVVPVMISADVSKFKHRRELVYLPPAWFASNPPPRLPTVMMIGSALNTPEDWLRAGDAVNTVDAFASSHSGYGPALVFADATGAFNNDTECVNGSRGNAADHLIKEVVPFMISNFGTSAKRENWGVVGWSMGGTCAVDLTVMHSEIFSAFVDIAGDRRPSSGTKDETIARLFGGNAAAYAAYDPANVISRHGKYAGVWGLFDVPDRQGNRRRDAAANPEGQDAAATSLAALASRRGIQCSVVTQLGRHDWAFAAQAFAAALPWLAGQLHTPQVPHTAMPPSR